MWRSLVLAVLAIVCCFPAGAQAQELLTQPAPELAALLALEQATISAIEKAEHSVVAIARVRRDRQPNSPFDPLQFTPPLGAVDSPDSPDFVPTLFGSGVVISEDGYIVTCAHVLDDPRRQDYFVWLDKQSYPAQAVGYPAEVLASDPFSDLAVLKIDAPGLTPIRFGDTAALRKGQFVIALGNPEAIARDGQASASWGIISNLKRVAPSESDKPTAVKETIHQLGTLIQTDAKLTLGMSGGALVNLRGEMIGLTTSLAAIQGAETSAGFAIATDDLFLRAVERLKLGRLPEYGFLGIQPEDLSSLERQRGLVGARVSAVVPGWPGAEAGLRADDVIVQVGDAMVADRNDLFRELSRAAAGARVSLRVKRVRPGLRVMDEVVLQADLSKKLISTSRPAYARNERSPWRGLKVEYSTAISSELARSGLLLGRQGSPKLVIAEVEPDTAAWAAGLRPGQGIFTVDGVAVETPAEFEDAVADKTGTVDLGIVGVDGRGRAVAMPAPPETLTR
jgi:serine protease Do